MTEDEESPLAFARLTKAIQKGGARTERQSHRLNPGVRIYAIKSTVFSLEIGTQSGTRPTDIAWLICLVSPDTIRIYAANQTLMIALTNQAAISLL